MSKKKEVKNKVNRSINVDKSVWNKAKDKAGPMAISYIVESLLEQYNAGKLLSAAEQAILDEYLKG